MERTVRIAEEIRKEISNIIMTDIKDPRLPDLVSITAVRVTNDLKYAKIYISVFGEEKERENAIDALTSAAGYIRRQIGQRIKIRYTPELKFIIDDSIEHGFHISKLLHDNNIDSNKN